MPRAGQHTDDAAGRIAECRGGWRNPDLCREARTSMSNGSLFDDDEGQSESRSVRETDVNDPQGRSGPLGRPDDPLAERMRPRTLDEVVGQDQILGSGTPLREAIERDHLQS